MAFYVLALTDHELSPSTVGGRTYRSLVVGNLVAIGERRLRPPRVGDQELRRQHAALVEISTRADAVLPVRFGTLIEPAELARVVSRNEAEIRRALEEVRGRRQMTVRFIRRSRPAAQRPALSSGRAYLERKRKSQIPRIPTSGKALLEAVRPVVARERTTRGIGRVLATVYHLVDVASAARYLAAADDHRAPGIVVTGPLPPYAFTPSLL